MKPIDIVEPEELIAAAKLIKIYCTSINDCCESCIFKHNNDEYCCELHGEVPGRFPFEWRFNNGRI